MPYYSLYRYEDPRANCSTVDFEKKDKLYAMFENYAKAHKKAFVCFTNDKTIFNGCYIVNATIGNENQFSVLLTNIATNATDLFLIDDIKNICCEC